LPRSSAIRLEREPNKFRVSEEWHLLKEKSPDYFVIPAKAGIQGLKIIGRQAESGCQLALETAPAFPVLPPSMAVALA